ncbi:DUF7512 family protein [Haladaptatus sp. ZSTT2]
MFGIETLPATVQAAATVGFVLSEALVLYVGYGTLTSLAGPTLNETVQGD